MLRRPLKLPEMQHEASGVLGARRIAGSLPRAGTHFDILSFSLGALRHPGGFMCAEGFASFGPMANAPAIQERATKQRSQTCICVSFGVGSSPANGMALRRRTRRPLPCGAM